MGLPLINPPIWVLIRTRLAQLQKINYSFNKADTELIKKLYDRLFITDKTKIRYLITRISDDKKLDNKKLDNKKLDKEKLDNEKLNNEKFNNEKLERVNIIFDYRLLIIGY